jgi:hypothetical protein
MDERELKRNQRMNPVAPNPNNQLQGSMGRWLFVIAGSLLIVAGLLKSNQLFRDLGLQGKFLTNYLHVILGVTAEFVLGVWLLSGMFPVISRLFAIFAFGVFFLVSIDRALDGEISCGCFGNVAVTPWVTAVIDLVILTLLVTLRRAPPTSATLSRWVILLAIGLFIVGLPVVLIVLYTSTSSVMTTVPTTVDVGELPQGGRAETIVFITNRSNERIEVVALRVTCPCVSITPDHWSLDSGGQMPVTIILDLAKEPEFVGRLGVTITGESIKDQPIFRLTLNATVIRPHS